MFDLISAFVAALLLVAAGSASRPAIRSSLNRPRLWISIAAAASALSLASALHSTRRQSGTGLQISFGWPKPWSGRWESFEDDQMSSGYNLLYFAGNTLFYAAVILVTWLIWRLVTDRIQVIADSSIR
jgi:hypothetical protein